MGELHTYRFIWRDGSINVGDGRNPAEALTLMGFGGGAVAALDYYETLPMATSAGEAK